jgi:peptidoglycan/xylan/chitin deacetylase (PgdA/CDA1 family)
MADWQESIDSTNMALMSIVPAGQQRVKYFRPPYGQRTLLISEYVEKAKQQVMLWNIDSQDWNAHITAEQMSGRMVSLMLLWRRGILLFHDVHPKARKALPEILNATEKAGVRWIRCR